MKLKQLEIQGYKSFANKVEFVFDDGITAVVGPNGSGKSNVADAIRWVLGEQSYSTLRGKKTEDMIFAGSDGRARLGMASATLVLDNSDRGLPLDFSEVTVTRRAYRSGENEYYLNGSRVRLRDVAELLAKGGLSRQTYTVIGQGTIDRVLSLHADDRRQLFEEAAGITFHHKQRGNALDRLKATQDNLLRLNDIVKEIEPQLGRLERQAERAKEYELVKTHLDGLLRVWYGYRWGQAQRQFTEARERLQHNEATLNSYRAKLKGLNNQLDTLRTEQTEGRASLSLWYSENNGLNKQAEAIQRELAVNEERAHQFAAQRDEILAELEPLTVNLQAQEQTVNEAQQALETINQALAQAEADLKQRQSQLEAQQGQLAAAEKKQTAAEASVRELAASLTQRQTRLAQLAERREVLLAEQATRQTEIVYLGEQQAELESTQQQLTDTLQNLAAELAALETEQAQLSETLSQLNQSAEEYKNELTALNRQEGALKARQDVLDKLRNDMSGYYAGVRSVLQPDVSLNGILGTVSQIIHATPELEVALEAALGSRLQDVVVESFADAEAAIAHLKQSRGGRATFLPLDTIRVGRATQVPDTPGVLGLASELVRVDDERLRPIVEFALNRTVVTEDLPAARRAFSAIEGGFQIVTKEGELMRSGGAVTGGRANGQTQEGTFLAREREWRELPQQLAEIAKLHDTASNRLASVHDEATAVKDSLQRLAEQHRQKSRQQQETQGVADKTSRAMEQLAASVTWQEELQAKTDTEIEQINGRQEDTRQEITKLNQEHAAAQEAAQALARQTQALSAESMRAEVSRAQASLATIKERQRTQQTILKNNRAGHQQLTGQIKSKQLRAESLAAQRQALQAQQQELHTRTGQFAERLESLGASIREAEKNLAELEVKEIQQQQEERQLRQRLQRLDEEHNRFSVETARCQNELDNLQEHIQEDLGMVQLELGKDQVGQPLLPIRPLVTDLPTVKELPPGVDEDVKRLKVQLRRLGNINLEAPREYADMRERYDFLNEQIVDLEAAITDLREVIAKLDQAMEEAFLATFQQVATEFQRYFKALFGGGEAQLLLTDPDNIINTGVDVVARPPGKRLQSMALLSGGERSLTAQALIFALLQTSPTPFVIFDEVDAMLDEANVSRFRDALVDLALDIQFIVITHNRKTIEAANMLYGISMGDDSVSQAYSLKIDEWLQEKPEKERVR